MSIKLSEEQIEKLKTRKDIAVWRPQYCRIVHIHSSVGERHNFWPLTYCGNTFPRESAVKPFLWTDGFCEECVKEVLFNPIKSVHSTRGITGQDVL